MANSFCPPALQSLCTLSLACERQREARRFPVRRTRFGISRVSTGLLAEILSKSQFNHDGGKPARGDRLTIVTDSKRTLSARAVRTERRDHQERSRLESSSRWKQFWRKWPLATTERPQRMLPSKRVVVVEHASFVRIQRGSSAERNPDFACVSLG